MAHNYHYHHYIRIHTQPHTDTHIVVIDSMTMTPLLPLSQCIYLHNLWLVCSQFNFVCASRRTNSLFFVSLLLLSSLVVDRYCVVLCEGGIDYTRLQQTQLNDDDRKPQKNERKKLKWNNCRRRRWLCFVLIISSLTSRFVWSALPHFTSRRTLNSIGAIDALNASVDSVCVCIQWNRKVILCTEEETNNSNSYIAA